MTQKIRDNGEKSDKVTSFIVWMILLSPLWITLILLAIGTYQEKHPVVRHNATEGMSYPRVEFPEYNGIDSETEYNKESKLFKDSGQGKEIILRDGSKINIELSDEEILEQLEFDYQDLYDYYGGADELY